MFDDLLDLFDRDKRHHAPRRRGLGGVLQRLAGDDDHDRRGWSAGPRRHHDHGEGWDDESSGDRRIHRGGRREVSDWDEDERDERGPAPEARRRRRSLLGELFDVG